jgi:hypothetical protein
MKIFSHTLSLPSHTAKCSLIGGVALTLALTGCGGGTKNASSTSEAGTTITTATTTSASTTTTLATTTTTTNATPSAITITIQIKGGKPVGGIRRATVRKGEQIALVVHSDVADEVHVHGYDLSKDVKAGGTVRIRFKAKLTGVFEVELENRSLQFAALTVK